MITKLMLILKSIFLTFIKRAKILYKKTTGDEKPKYKTQVLLRKTYMSLVKNISTLLSAKDDQFDLLVNKMLEESYVESFLYFSDEVIKKLNTIVEHRLHKRDQPSELIYLFQDLLIQIRKEIFKDTKLKHENVKFILRINKLP